MLLSEQEKNIDLVSHRFTIRSQDTMQLKETLMREREEELAKEQAEMSNMIFHFKQDM